MTHNFEQICLSVGINIDELEKMVLHIHKDNFLLLAECDYVHRFHSFVLRDGDFPKETSDGIPIALAFEKDLIKFKTIQLISLHRIVTNKFGIIDIADEE